MLWNVIVFGSIGLFVGAAARLFYPGRELGKVLGTVVLGIGGSLAGGAISLACWPVTEGRFDPRGLVMSLGVAVFVLALWAGVVYARRVTKPV